MGTNRMIYDKIMMTILSTPTLMSFITLAYAAYLSSLVAAFYVCLMMVILNIVLIIAIWVKWKRYV